MLKFVNKTIKSMLISIITLGYTVSYAETSRHLYVISDLHIGVGKVDDSNKKWGDRAWDNLEDFRWHDEFDNFIDDIIKESKNNADLVIAGDFFELWQGRDNLCDHKDNKDIGCSEDEALERLKRITYQHKQVFKALKKFVTIKGNKLIIIPGNHDAALLFPQVAKYTLEQFERQKQNVTIAQTGLWLNEDKRIIIDHGHQVKYDVNRFKKWPNPFITYKGTIYLRKTAGEQLVQKLFNDLEDDLPLVDNMSSEWQGFKAAVDAGKWDSLGSALSSGVGFLFQHMSWTHAGSFLDGEKSLDVNVTAVKQNEGQTFFYNSVEENTTLHISLKKLVTENNLSSNMDSLSDETIKKICNYRYNEYEDQKKKQLPITIKPCNSSSTTDLSAMGHVIFGESKKTTMAKYIRTLEGDLIKQKKTKGLITYIFGHTHKYQTNDEYPDGAWSMDVLNTGAWQRVVSVDKLKEIAESKNIEDIFTLTVDDIPACYTYVSAKGYQDPLKMDVKLNKWGKGCSNWE